MTTENKQPDDLTPIQQVSSQDVDAEVVQMVDQEFWYLLDTMPRATTQQANKGDERSAYERGWDEGHIAGREKSRAAPQAVPSTVAGSVVGVMSTFSGKHGMTWLVDPTTLSEGTKIYAALTEAPQAVTLSDEQREALNLAKSFMPNNTMARERAHSILDALLAAHPTEQRMSDAEDAARWRWLRDHAEFMDAAGNDLGMGEKLDAAIDAARKGDSQ